MKFTEAKEHAPGHLHAIFAAPYEAFDNEVVERKLHLGVALQALLAGPLESGNLVLRVLHGRENSDVEPEALRHSDHAVASRTDIAKVQAADQAATERRQALPKDEASLLAQLHDAAIARARDQGLEVDEQTRQNPAHWSAFEGGLALYTFFKVYHRLTYGEDESYRSIRCLTPPGSRVIHESYLEEGEFAICTPLAPDRQDATLLIVQEDELNPFLESLESHLSATLDNKTEM